jgi:hypothetical protein
MSIRPYKPIPVAVRSKAQVCGRLVAGVAGSNPARGHECLSVVLSCAGRGLFDGLITHPEESYRMSLYVCDQETPKERPMICPGL